MSGKTIEEFHMDKAVAEQEINRIIDGLERAYYCHVTSISAGSFTYMGDASGKRIPVRDCGISMTVEF